MKADTAAARPPAGDGVDLETARTAISAEALDRLVYVAGSARGGTTLMLKCLGIHPKILALPKLSHFVDQTWPHRRKLSQRLFQIVFALPFWYDVEAALASLSGGEQNGVKRRIATCLRQKSFRELYQLYPLIYSLTPANQKDNRQIAVWADKSNDHGGLQTIGREFPAAKFLFLTRDPRSVVLSQAKRLQMTSGDAKARTIDLPDLFSCALYWRLFMQTLQATDRRFPGRCMFLRYEDLVRRPEQTLNAAFEFVAGEDLPDEAIAAALARLRGGASNEGEIYSGLTTAAVDRWRTALSADEIGLIEALTGRTASRLGYQATRPYSPLLIAKHLLRLNGTAAKLKKAIMLLYLQGREIVA